MCHGAGKPLSNSLAVETKMLRPESSAPDTAAEVRKAMRGEMAQVSHLARDHRQAVNLGGGGHHRVFGQGV
jgi:hypothetical protein